VTGRLKGPLRLTKRAYDIPRSTHGVYVSQTQAPATRAQHTPLTASAKRWSRGGRGYQGLLCGLLVLATCLWLAQHGVLQGWPLLALTALLVLALPTARQLSWRITIAGATLFGAVPLLWWIPLPPGVPHWGPLLFALLISGITVRILGSDNRRACLKSLLPSASKADCYLLVAALFAAIALAPYFLVFTGPQALGVLLTSWDNSSHFDMYNMLRHHGTVIPMTDLPAEGRSWSFIEYPQGFHAAVATMAELVIGPEPGTLAQELVVYSRLSSLVAVVSAVFVTAGITSLPWIRRRPLLSAPFVVLVITAWSFGTASHATFYAYQNFLLGVALLASLMVIAAFADSLATPIVFAAAASTVVGIAQTWSLLLILALPALLLAIFPWIGSRWVATKTGWAMDIGTTIFALGGLLLVGYQISRVETDNIVAATGSVQSSTHGVEIATLLVAATCSILLAHGSLKQFFTGRGKRHASARLILVPAVGLITVITMGAYQIITLGKVTYYTMKLALAVELLLPVVACVTVTALVDRWLTTHQYVHPRGLVSMSVLTALASTQVFGLTVPDTKPLGMEALAPYQRGMSIIAFETGRNSPSAHELFLAADSYASDQGDAVFVTSYDEVDPLLAATWYLSLTGTHKDNTNRILGELRPLYDGYTGNLKLAVENVLDGDPAVSVVLARNLHNFLASSDLSEAMLSRVTSYN
jgi:hypothetical protein